MGVFRTYKFRIKDSVSGKYLDKMAESVNFVWNYCNETSYNVIKDRKKYLSYFDLCSLTKGCSNELNISSSTIKEVCRHYVSNRNRFKRTKLSWRDKKRSLGWIPVQTNYYRIENDKVMYFYKEFKFWKSREINGKLKRIIFSQDAKKNWYVNIESEIELQNLPSTGKEIGIDLGLKVIATDSDGNKYSRENLTKKYEKRISMAHRAKKKKIARKFYAKAKNSRLDWTHKTTTNIVKKYDTIFIGDVSPTKVSKTMFTKSTFDASWYLFKTLLAYKAIGLGREYKEVKENFSTVTCSTCLNKNDLGGLGNLGVREWTCEFCGTKHDRDVNSAKNILRFGHESPKGALIQERCQVESGFLIYKNGN